MKLAVFNQPTQEGKEVIVSVDHVVSFHEFEPGRIIITLDNPQGVYQLVVAGTMLEVAGKLEGSI